MRAAALLRRFLARDSGERRLLLEALAALAAARIRLLCLPFRRVAAGLGVPGREGAPALPPAREQEAARLGRAVAACARWVPWDGRCLAQAIAAARLLRRRGLECTLYLGVARDPDRPAGRSFHAWLRCGSRVVTGGGGRGGYRVLARFLEPGREPRP